MKEKFWKWTGSIHEKNVKKIIRNIRKKARLSEDKEALKIYGILIPKEDDQSNQSKTS